MRSVVKGNYLKGKGGIKHAIAHVRYLQMRGGDDRDSAFGKKRLFFNDTRQGISGADVIAQLNKQHEKGVVAFRIVLSPGLEGVDMLAYTRVLMAELQSSKGQDLIYFATEHKNTDHTHNHLIIMGRDQHHKTVRITSRDYNNLRATGDRYIERYHQLDRYLDRDSHLLMRNGYKRDRGDQAFEWLLADLKNPKSLDEIEQERFENHRLHRQSVIDALPEEEKIDRDGTRYTRFSSLHDLLDLNEKLANGELARLPKEQYRMMWSWIGNKKQFGDDYYDRTIESDRLFKQFDDELRQSLKTDNSPPKSFKQFVFESRGRLLEWHEKYAIDTQRYRLQKELLYFDQNRKQDQNGEQDPRERKGLIDQLDWLDTLSCERCESHTKLPVVRRLKEKERMDSQTEPIRSEVGTFTGSERENRILAVQNQLQEQLRQAQQDQERLEKHLEQHDQLTNLSQNSIAEQSALENLSLVEKSLAHPEHAHPAQAHPAHAHPAQTHPAQAHTANDHSGQAQADHGAADKAPSQPHNLNQEVQDQRNQESHNRDERHDEVAETTRHEVERMRTTDRVRFDAENTFKQHKELQRLKLFLEDYGQKYPDTFASRFQQLLDNITREFVNKHHEHHEQSDQPEHFLDIPLKNNNIEQGKEQKSERQNQLEQDERTFDDIMQNQVQNNFMESIEKAFPDRNQHERNAAENHNEHNEQESDRQPDHQKNDRYFELERDDSGREHERGR